MNELLEHNRLEEWLNETSQYLEEKFPELAYFRVTYSSDDSITWHLPAYLSLSVVLPDSPFVRRVFLPHIREKLVQATFGQGYCLSRPHKENTLFTFCWPVSEAQTRLALRRAIPSAAFTPMEIRSMIIAPGIRPFRLKDFLRDDEAIYGTCYYPNVPVGPNRSNRG